MHLNMNDKGRLILYHGTNFDQLDKVKIDVNIGRDAVDFGKGFYTTTNKNQAVKWASRKDADGYVYEYSIPKEIFHNGLLNTKELTEYNEECIKILAYNRNNIGTVNSLKDKDIVFGVMADSNSEMILEVLDRYALGELTLAEVKKMIRTKSRKYNQYCFKTERSIKYLKPEHKYIIKMQGGKVKCETIF